MYKRFLFIFIILISTSKIFAECADWKTSWWCDVKYGLTMATGDEGKNGIMLSGLAYHLSVSPHVLSGFWQDGAGMLNEFAYGAGYTRSYYNPNYNSEYSIFFLVFSDSYWQPETHVGYMYQQFLNINNSGDWKWGYGYMLGVMNKVAYGGPLILPAAGLVTSVKYKNTSLMLTYALQLLLTLKIDFD